MTRRGWIDALFDLIDAAPAPRWAVYLALYAVGFGGTQVANWIDGIVAFPEIAPSLLVGAVFPVAFPWSMQALNDVAMRSLETLRPALELDAAGQAALAVEIGQTPAAVSVAVIPAGVIVGVASVLGSPSAWGLRDDIGPASWAATYALSVATMVLLLAFLAHVLHQLRVVGRVHRHFVRVDLFHLEPLYAFATLTARTGMALLGLVVFGIVGLSLTTGQLIGLASTDLGVTLAMLLVAVASFIVPLLGLHGRISAERDRRREEAAVVVARTVGEIQARSAAGEHDAVGALNNSLQAATTAMTTVSKISTWPWRPETLRGFVSAIGLPVVVWVITAVLSRVIPR